MNIFATDPSPIVSAQSLDDKRLIKMILETAQLLSGAIREYDPTNPALYKPTHMNHPCAIWVRADKRNFNWTIMHFTALSAEYQHRFSKEHASFTRLSDTIDEWTYLPPAPPPTHTSSL